MTLATQVPPLKGADDLDEWIGLLIQKLRIHGLVDHLFANVTEPMNGTSDRAATVMIITASISPVRNHLIAAGWDFHRVNQSPKELYDLILKVVPHIPQPRVDKPGDKEVPHKPQPSTDDTDIPSDIDEIPAEERVTKAAALVRTLGQFTFGNYTTLQQLQGRLEDFQVALEAVGYDVEDQTLVLLAMNALKDWSPTWYRSLSREMVAGNLTWQKLLDEIAIKAKRGKKGKEKAATGKAALKPAKNAKPTAGPSNSKAPENKEALKQQDSIENDDSDSERTLLEKRAFDEYSGFQQSTPYKPYYQAPRVSFAEPVQHAKQTWGDYPVLPHQGLTGHLYPGRPGLPGHSGLVQESYPRQSSSSLAHPEPPCPCGTIHPGRPGLTHCGYPHSGLLGANNGYLHPNPPGLAQHGLYIPGVPGPHSQMYAKNQPLVKESAFSDGGLPKWNVHQRGISVNLGTPLGSSTPVTTGIPIRPLRPLRPIPPIPPIPPIRGPIHDLPTISMAQIENHMKNISISMAQIKNHMNNASINTVSTPGPRTDIFTSSGSQQPTVISAYRAHSIGMNSASGTAAINTGTSQDTPGTSQAQRAREKAEGMGRAAQAVQREQNYGLLSESYTVVERRRIEQMQQAEADRIKSYQLWPHAMTAAGRQAGAKVQAEKLAPENGATRLPLYYPAPVMTTAGTGWVPGMPHSSEAAGNFRGQSIDEPAGKSEAQALPDPVIPYTPTADLIKYTKRLMDVLEIKTALWEQFMSIQREADRMAAADKQTPEEVNVEEQKPKHTIGTIGMRMSVLELGIKTMQAELFSLDKRRQRDRSGKLNEEDQAKWEDFRTAVNIMAEQMAALEIRRAKGQVMPTPEEMDQKVSKEDGSFWSTWPLGRISLME